MSAPIRKSYRPFRIGDFIYCTSKNCEGVVIGLMPTEGAPLLFHVKLESGGTSWELPKDLRLRRAA